MIKHYFRLDKLGTTIGRELTAGSTTFLTMAYIIFVNPQILSATGMDKGALITATILASIFGTVLVGLWANVPFAMAPGMGLNAFFAYTLVLENKIPWETALGAVFISGFLFLVLTYLGIRSKVVKAIPLELRLSIGAGIGLLITFIGLQNLGLIVESKATMVTLARGFTPSLIIGLSGLVFISILSAWNVRGAMLLGIAFTTVTGIISGEVNLPGAVFSAPPSLKPLFFKLNVLDALEWSLWWSIFSLMFMDLFDSVGTIMGCSYEAGLVNKDGTIENVDRMLEADALATIFGSLVGTSTTTTYLESGAGISEGGRSGLSSVFTGILFFGALFFTPLIMIVPKFATAPVLIIVGIYMFKNVQEINFKKLEEGIPAFLTIILMPMTFSISTGLSFGFLSHILIATALGKARNISPVMWCIGILAAMDLVIH